MVFLIIRIAAIFLIMWAAFQLINYILQTTSNTITCPRCEGKGFWYDLRERNDCKQCNKTGRISK